MRMRTICFFGTLVFAFMGSYPAQADLDIPLFREWKFDQDVSNRPPIGFSFGRTGKGALGRWIVLQQSDAPSGNNVLAQVNRDPTNSRFPLAIAVNPWLNDLVLSVKCKLVSGLVSQTCGLVFRYQDENNYYIVHANALEDNVSLDVVKNGKVKVLANWLGRVASDTWHELSVRAQGYRFEVIFNKKKIIEATNEVTPDVGMVGIGTKADSITYFDDLTVAPFSGTMERDQEEEENN